jgi:hypothetical protein
MSITSTVVNRAEIQFREADVALRPYVGCFWVISAERDATIRIVPDGSTSISTELGSGRTSGWWQRCRPVGDAGPETTVRVARHTRRRAPASRSRVHPQRDGRECDGRPTHRSVHSRGMPGARRRGSSTENTGRVH